MHSSLQKEIRVLRTYVFASTTLFAVLSLAAFSSGGQKPRFAEIDVERINVIEKDGTLRLVIANSTRSPAPVSKGKVFGKPGGRPGLIFYNDKGGENGGLGFAGRLENGKVNSFGSLTFDQYNQDQVVALQYSEEAGQRRAGLTILDRPDVALADVIERQRVVRAMPEGPAKDSAWSRLAAYQGGVPFGAPRLFVGRDPSKAAVLAMSDKTGKVRLRLMVDSTGVSSLAFLDDSGRVTFSLPAALHPAADSVRRP
jgi:hypothetical protein